MPTDWDGVFWIIVTLAPLIVLQRSLHREIQLVFLLITRRIDLSVTLFSIIFFPGVLLHEGSHYLTARILGVRTGRFSLLPKPVGNGKVQLGFVETASTDWVRDALIGMAPLIAGGLFVAYAGIVQMEFVTLGQLLWTAGPQAFSQFLTTIMAQPDFWLWIYLTLVVSSTMLPSESDRRAWLPLGLILISLIALSLAFGAGPWLAENLAEPFNQVLRAISIVFAISVILHFVLLPFVWLIRKLMARLLGLEVML
jgi:hypothetical protein